MAEMTVPVWWVLLLVAFHNAIVGYWLGWRAGLRAHEKESRR